MTTSVNLIADWYELLALSRLLSTAADPID
jgi:hypothetical protein